MFGRMIPLRLMWIVIKSFKGYTKDPSLRSIHNIRLTSLTTKRTATSHFSRKNENC